MSIIKTKCPNLEELSTAIGSIDGTDSSKYSRPLCENIFDVQRGELFEVLERLRLAFWSDQVNDSSSPPPAILPVQVNLPSSKRARSEVDEDINYQQEVILTSPTPKKRARIENIPETTTQEPSFLYYSSLWPFKKLLIQQIRNSTHKDTEVISFMNQIYQTKSKDQCRHMSLYLLPVAKAMRKQHIIDVLNKWL